MDCESGVWLWTIGGRWKSVQNLEKFSMPFEYCMLRTVCYVKFACELPWFNMYKTAC
jgi:hypothetical protein